MYSSHSTSKQPKISRQSTEFQNLGTSKKEGGGQNAELMKRRIADWLGTSRALGTPFKELSPVVGWAASQKSSQMGVHGVSLRHLGPRCGGRGASVVGLCSTRPWLFTCVGPACRITGGRRALAAAGTFRSDTENIKDNDEDGNQGRPKLDKRMKAMLAWEREQWHLRQVDHDALV